MLSLAFGAVDDTAIAVQQDLHNLEHHLLALRFRKPQWQAPITSIFGHHQALQVQQAIGASCIPSLFQINSPLHRFHVTLGRSCETPINA